MLMTRWMVLPLVLGVSMFGIVACSGPEDTGIDEGVGDEEVLEEDGVMDEEGIGEEDPVLEEEEEGIGEE